MSTTHSMIYSSYQETLFLLTVSHKIRRCEPTPNLYHSRKVKQVWVQMSTYFMLIMIQFRGGNTQIALVINDGGQESRSYSLQTVCTCLKLLPAECSILDIAKSKLGAPWCTNLSFISLRPSVPPPFFHLSLNHRLAALRPSPFSLTLSRIFSECFALRSHSLLRLVWVVG